MKRFLKYFLVFFLIAAKTLATHNRAGEITFQQISLLQYKVKIVTYTKTSSPADRPALEINWGDGTKDSLPRISKVTVGMPSDDVSRNYYEGIHTYPGPSTYIIFFEDPNRNGGVANIPGSVNVPFYVESKLIINPQLGYNNSPILLQPPIDNGCVGKIFVHNPNAYDPDGDSLSYELIKCKGAGGLDAPNYSFPNASNFFSLDVLTGDLLWDTPTSIGEFNIAFLIHEYRNGIEIGYVERDMQITIATCNNNPPQINVLNDLCVTAGTFISQSITATDSVADIIILTATGSPLDSNLTPVSYALFPTVFDTGSVTGTFTWQTECVHVKKSPYQILFKAQDNNPFVNLVDLQRLNITVVAPAPQNLTATPVSNTIQLNWQQTACVNAMGYKVYRRNGATGYTSPTCITGVPASTGYQLIAKVDSVYNTSYIDNNNGSGLVPGNNYCYLVISFFKDGAESYVSNEACVELIRDAPVITNVSILNTDVVTGHVYVAWSSPKVIDTAQTPGPYEYRVYRSNDFLGNNFTLAATFTNLIDTTFIDSLLNTKDAPWSYKIEFYNMTLGNTFKINQSLTASSIFLSTAPTDNTVQLTWEEHVPWTNNKYLIYRFDNTVGNFVLIDSSSAQAYNDDGLANDSTFCYKIESVGAYSGTGLVNPILNISQEKCETPFDNIKPCAPSDVNINASCDLEKATISWSKPDASCGDDVIKYYIYFSNSINGEPHVIAEITSGDSLSFTQTGVFNIPGCYYIVSVDSVGNESAFSQQVCTDNCPVYDLPNVFTPNGDGKNDLLVPFPYRFVESIELTVYNRWGNIVFETTDKDVNWKGTVDNKSKKLSDGTYYYVCTVNEIFLSGIRSRKFHGIVELIGNKK